MGDGIKEEKQYGLVLPKQKKLSAPKPGNIFGEDSGSDVDDGSDWVRKALRAEGEKNLIKKQTQLTMKRAMKEDPTVYQYDEVYDDIEKSKIEEKKSKTTVEKKSKYIENLLKAADRRKREQEHRVERMVQKEREAEGAMFADKESFVTSAYRAKLEEFKKMEEEEKRMDRLEAIGDVTKQQDMSGFYRQLYHQTVEGGEKNTDTGMKSDTELENQKSTSCDNAQKPDTVAVTPEKDNSNIDGDDPLTSDSEKGSEDEETKLQKVKEAKNHLIRGTNKRQYRKRITEESQSSSDSEHDTKNSEIKAATSAHKELSTEGDKPQEKKRKLSATENDLTTIDQNKENRDSKNGETDTKISRDQDQSESTESKEEAPKKEKVAKKSQPEKPKISIWEKRTVGSVFEAALERYYARKAARQSG